MDWILVRIRQYFSPHFIAVPLLSVVVADVLYPLPGVPGQVPVPVPGVELAPELLPRCHARPGNYANCEDKYRA